MREPRPPLRRPSAMRVDPAACVRCDLCDTLLPGVWANPERVPTSPAALEVMAACPTTAIVWIEDAASDPGG